MSFAVIASITIDPINNQTFEAALKVLFQATRREPGCIQYDVHASSDRQDSCFIVDLYMPEKDYLPHREQQQILDFRQIATQLFKEPPVVLRGELAW
jgi:quinol monooxygenase YgiN